jgi:hypothetical protein
VADVNIPVGEVFTSPVLTGTHGVLHVSYVYLNGLRYENLKMTFEDGKVVDYSCSNFDSEEENHKYIYDNVLMHHDTLPLGEFAIGTNTTAYRMAKDFDIADKLPILIAEKTGPHLQWEIPVIPRQRIRRFIIRMAKKLWQGIMKSQFFGKKTRVRHTLTAIRILRYRMMN